MNGLELLRVSVSLCCFLHVDRLRVHNTCSHNHERHLRL